MGRSSNQGLIRRALQDDGLPVEDVGRWALQKYEVDARYAHMFATGMKNLWHQRCYLGLCTGPGRARLRAIGEIVESSAITALRLPDPFTKYIFCDENPRALDTLRQRAEAIDWKPDISWVEGDVNEKIREIRAQIPGFGSGRSLVSLCFLDPYATNIRFATIRELGGAYLMDFLVVLPLGVDARRNLRRYMDPGETRIDEFLGDPDWRGRFRDVRAAGENVIHFLARRFSEQMSELGYKETGPHEMVPVRSSSRNLNLYLVGLLSKSDRGKDFWKKALAGIGGQTELNLT